MRKAPRDFVHIDEFWEAENDWPRYFIGTKVWVYYDEYNAELIGDEDYCRIIVHSSSADGLIYKRRLSERSMLDEVLKKIERPVSPKQLVDLGFEPWHGGYDDIFMGSEPFAVKVPIELDIKEL